MKLLKSFTDSKSYQELDPENLNVKEINLAVIKGDSGSIFSGASLVRVSQKGLLGVADFSEYSFLHIPKKYKYNSSSIFNYIESEEGIEIIDNFGDDVESIEKYTDVLVPTLSTVSGDAPRLDVFGSVYYDNKTFYAIPVSSGNSLVYLFENYNYTDENQYKFCVYFDKEEEVNQDKILWLIVSSDGTISDINISYYSWKTSNNKFENLNKYLLRNDDKAKIDTSDPVRIENDLVFDSTSGTLLGKKTTDSTPILDNLISYYKKGDLSKYSPQVSYQIGDEVSYGGKSYYSLISGNIGNTPILSEYWILKDFLDEKDISYHTKIMYVILSDPEAVEDYTQEVIVRCSDNLHFNTLTPIVLSGINDYTIDGIYYTTMNVMNSGNITNTINTSTIKNINLEVKDISLSSTDYIYVSLSNRTLDLGNINFNIHYPGGIANLTLSNNSNSIVSISTKNTGSLKPGSSNFSFTINAKQGTLDKNITAVYKGYSDTDILKKNLLANSDGVVQDNDINTRATEITYDINIVNLVSSDNNKTYSDEKFIYFSEYPGFELEVNEISRTKVSLHESNIEFILYPLDEDMNFNGGLRIYGENNQPIPVSGTTDNVINIVNGSGSGYILDKTDISDNKSGVYSRANIEIGIATSDSLRIKFQNGGGYSPYTDIYFKLENLS